MVVIICAAAALASMSAAWAIVQLGQTPAHSMNADRKLTREAFFGLDKELSPIEKGQETRPRW